MLTSKNTSHGSRQDYRPEIDGLRGIAILTVVFYHFGLGCPGGYIGVDIFFVISGYLISSLILRDLRAGTFSLAGFWERRVRRIFPALAACVLATLAAAWFLLLPDDLINLGKSAVAQALLCANIYFWRTTNYFASADEAKPLLHTWSLAVEEQFYLFFPLLLFALFRYPALRRPRTLVTLALFGLVFSLSIAAWGVKHQPYTTFFLLPTRAWELLCGVLVAALPASASPRSRLTQESASWLGLAAILAPVWAYGETTPFPGIAALPPCLGTALVIWATGQRPEARDQRSDARGQMPEVRCQRSDARGQMPEVRGQRSEVRSRTLFSCVLCLAVLRLDHHSSLRPPSRLHRPDLLFPLSLALAAHRLLQLSMGTEMALSPFIEHAFLTILQSPPVKP